METLLAGLNGPQKEAVLEFDHPLLVLAGAGSGKTRVITTKIAYAIGELHVAPWKILAVTFTNKAAQEMQQRVQAMLGDEASSGCTIRTFHGFGAYLLRRFSDKAGLSPRFSIYDDSDSYDLLKKAMPGKDAKIVRQQCKQISLCKDKGITPDMLRKDGKGELADAYRIYQQQLDATGNVDFADLILKATRLLDDPDVKDWAHGRFKVILVDEYQDTNACQFTFLKKLAGPETFVCVVGDDDQSIYRFRGAEVGNIDAFRRTFSDVRTIKLEQNYRSTPSILNLANSVIIHNHKEGDLKKLWTENKDVQKPQLYYVDDEGAEARLVARKLKELGDWDHSAVLFRTNAQSGQFENVFTRPEYRIPYKVVGALKFYDREQVKDGLGMMYLLSNPRDIVSFRRMVNKPPRGIGPGALAKIEEAIPSQDGDCLKALACTALGGKAREGANAFLDCLEGARALIDQGKLTDGLSRLFKSSGLVDYYAEQDKKEGKTKEEGSRVADFDTLLTQDGEYGNDWDALSGFLETLALDPTTVGYLDPREKKGVTLITMHNTKGLEFDNVFVVGLEEGLFPSLMSMDEDPLCREERRLFYVSVTRAKKRLFLTSARRRMLFGQTKSGQPSRFLTEIGKGLVDVHDESSMERHGLFDDESPWHRGESLYKRGVSGGWRGMDSLGEKRWRREGMSQGVVLHKGFGEHAKKFSFEVTHKEEGGSTIFHPGEKVLSESYGPGVVQSVSAKGGPEVVTVVFSTGRKATFISKYAKLEKVAD